MKTRNFLLASICILQSVICSAQAPSFLWAKSAGLDAYDEGRCVSTDPSGNVYVTGPFQGTSIVFGTTTLTNADITGNYADMFIVKYDASGNVLWAKGAGGPMEDLGNSISTDASGNVYVTGYFSSSSIVFDSTTLTNAGSSWSDFFIVKYDPTGNVLWAKRGGGIGIDRAQCVSTDVNGNVTVLGHFQGSPIVIGTTTLINASSGGTSDFFIVKYDASGNVLFAKSAGGTGDDYGASTKTDANGNVFVVGSFQSSSILFGVTTLTNAGLNDAFIVKYDASGNVMWAKSAGGTDNDGISGISCDTTGNIYVTGSFQSSSIAFATTTLTNLGIYDDIFIVKYDTSGNVIWAKSAGGTDLDYVVSMCSDTSGNIYITGTYYSPSIAFGTAILTNPDLFIVKYDPSGNVLGVKNTGAPNAILVNSISTDAYGNAYLTGGFLFSPAVFGTTSLVNADNTGMTTDMFITKLGTFTGVEENQLLTNITIYPNPFSSQTVFETSLYLNSATLTVYNSMGQAVVQIKNLNGQKITFNRDNLSSGLYFVTLTQNNKVIAKEKLVITDK